MISMKSKPGMGLFLIKISKSSPTCTKSLFLSMNFINLLTFVFFWARHRNISPHSLSYSFSERARFRPISGFQWWLSDFSPMPKDLIPRLALSIFSSHRTASLASLEFFLCQGIWPFWSSPAFLMSSSLISRAFWVRTMLSLVLPSFWVWTIFSLVSHSFWEWMIYWWVLPVLLVTVFFLLNIQILFWARDN